VSRQDRVRGPSGAALALLLPWLLAACVSVPPPTAPPVTAIRGDPPFELSGRLAVRDGERSLTASIRWYFDGVGDRLSLSGPLGLGAAEIERHPGGVVFRDGRGERRAPDAQSLMIEALGFALPLDGLRYWVRGQPGPGGRSEAVARDERGRLVAFAEDGWSVTIPVYSAHPLAALPRRLEVEARGLRVRLLIDAWLQPPVGGADGS
jgi:outer membrane lipoprotein LolB